jgi:hypothetical protein
MADRPATPPTEEIEITPEMIEAACNALCALALDSDSYLEIATAIYDAMEKAKKAIPIPGVNPGG